MRYTYQDYLRDHPVVKAAPVEVEVESKDEAPVVEVCHKKKFDKKSFED